MDRTNKENLATELKGKFEKANLALFADYKGLKAGEADTLRRSLRAAQTEVQVLKNNIGRLISKNGEMGDDAKAVMDRVVGPTLVAFAYGDVAAAAKVFNDFAKAHEALKIKESLYGKKLLSPAEITQLAELPSREVLLSMLLSVMNGPVRNFVTVLGQLEKKRTESTEPTQA
jgi:large subunit ribosomal protein L10